VVNFPSHIEPFRYEDGELGLALVFENESVELGTPNHWINDSRFGGDKDFIRRIQNLINEIYWENEKVPLPGMPKTEWDGDNILLRDIERVLNDLVEFISSEYCILQTHWSVCTWIKELLRFAPRNLIYGPTGSGKSQIIDFQCAICHRGHDYTSPTIAALYRDIEEFYPTVCIDSIDRIRGSKWEDIELIWEKGFTKGGTVARVGENGKRERFKVYSWMTLAGKKLPKAEDLQNRSVHTPMAEKSSDFEPIRRIDLDLFSKLQTRLLSLRLAILSGKLDVEPFLKKASDRALAWEPKLSPRSIDMAESLLVPSFLFYENSEDSIEAILTLLSNSESRSKHSLMETIEAQAHFAVCAVREVNMRNTTLEGDSAFKWSKISTRDINDQVNCDLREQGNIGKDDIKTRTTTNSLQVLGYSFNLSSGNRSYFDPNTSEEVFKRCVRKYGTRGK
jgi:hypothetical protein